MNNIFRLIFEVLGITLPIYIIIAVGFLARKRKIVEKDSVKALNKITYNIGLPALIILSITKYRLSEIFDLRMVLTLYSTFMIFLVLTVLGIHFSGFENKTKGAVIVSSIRSNMAFIGLPLVFSAYGDQALAKASLMVALLSPLNVLTTVIVFKFYHRSDHTPVSRRDLLRILADPLIFAALIGLALSFFKVDLPEILLKSLDILTAMTIGLALVTIGASFSFSQVKANIGALSIISFLKLLVLPVIAFLFSKYVFRLEDINTNIMVILHAMPMAVSAFIMGKRHNSDHGLITSALIFTTIISSFTLSSLLLVLKFLER